MYCAGCALRPLTASKIRVAREDDADEHDAVGDGAGDAAVDVVGGNEAHGHVTTGDEAEIERRQVRRLLRAARDQRHRHAISKPSSVVCSGSGDLKIALRTDVAAVTADRDRGILRERGD